MNSDEDDNGADSEDPYSDDDEMDEPSFKDGKKRTAGNSRKQPKKKAKSLASRFFANEVDVGSDEDDDDEGMGDLRGEAQNEELTRAEEEALRVRNENRASRAQWDDADAYVDGLQQRHLESRRREHVDVNEGSASQQLPSIKDPKLFSIECKPNIGQELMLQLFNKYIAKQNEGQPMRIFSAISASKKHIYVEAHQDSHVREAIHGFRFLYAYRLKLVPIQQMPEILAIKCTKVPLEENQWVRMRRMPYARDLGKCVFVLEGGSRAVIKYVPRIDTAVFSLSAEDAKAHKKRVKQPPQRMFDQSLMTELQDAGIEYSENHRTPPHWPPGLEDKAAYLYGNNYYIEGFLYKEVQTETMCEWSDVKPTLEELKSFQNNDEGEGYDDDDTSMQNLKFSSKTILDGLTNVKFESGTPISLLRRHDLIRVMEGDQKNLNGHVHSIDVKTNTLKMRPDHDEIRHTILDFKVTEVQKLIFAGDHVKVLAGRYLGETGTTVKVDTTDDQQWLAIILTDNSFKEIQVFVRDLQVSDEIAASLEQLGGYMMHDLVRLGQNSVGTIIGIGRDSFQVVDQDNRVQSFRLQQVRGKMNSQARSACALDQKKNIIRPLDQVIVMDGPRKGITAKIMHMHKAILFVHSDSILQNSGIFVMRARKVVIAGQKLSMDLANSYINIQKGSRRSRDDEIIGSTVRIIRGEYKGLIGIAVDASEKVVKIELHSTTKFVSIRRENVKRVGTKDGVLTQRAPTNAPTLGSQTPTMGGQTPVAGGATPMVGAMTPSYDSGDSNVWDPSSNSTATPQPPTPGGGVWDASDSGQGGTPGAQSGYTPSMGGSTPSMHEVSSPINGDDSATARTPVGSYGVATPGSPAEHLPSTPGASEGQDESNPSDEFDYKKFDVVKVTATDGGYDGLTGHVEELEDENKVIVQLDNNDETLIRINKSGLTPVLPQANDNVRVWGAGEYYNHEGKLVGIDGDDGIVRLQEGKVVVLELVNLIKKREVN